MQPTIHQVLTEPVTVNLRFQHIALVLLVLLVVFIAGYMYGVNRTLKRKRERFEFEN